MNSKKLLHIFKPGTQTAMNGMTLEFSAADLVACASAYDPAKHEAPIVIGHPTHDAPAYGWVKTLATDAAGLFAEQHQVDASFAELVGAGRFKKISASFYLPDAPNNPAPGVYYLRHVGFLGAQAPAVKGLKQAEFADAEQGVIEFGDWGMDANASLWRRMREWMLAKFGQEAADQVVPDWQIESIRESARQDDDADRAAFTEAAPSTLQTPAGVPPATTTKEKQVTPEEQAALTAENATLKQQLATAEAEKKTAAAAKRNGEHVAYAEQLVAAGTLAPKDKDTVVAVLDFADADTVVEFGEGAARQPLAKAFKAFLAAMPKVVEFGETALKGKAVDSGDRGTAEFAEKNVDPGRMALHQRATALATEKNISYEQAVRQLV